MVSPKNCPAVSNLSGRQPFSAKDTLCSSYIRDASSSCRRRHMPPLKTLLTPQSFPWTPQTSSRIPATIRRDSDKVFLHYFRGSQSLMRYSSSFLATDTLLHPSRPWAEQHNAHNTYRANLDRSSRYRGAPTWLPTAVVDYDESLSPGPRH